MAEYASKGLSGTALGLAIPGTVALVNQLSNGNGLLGGLFGGGMNNQQQDKILALTTENTQLKGQIYTDSQVKELNAEICGLRTEVQRQGAEIDCMNKTAVLREEITDGKIARVADAATCGINNLRCSLDCLQQTVSGITRTFVPAGSVTPLPAPYPYPPVPPYFPPFPPVPPVVQQPSTSTTPDATSGTASG